MVRDYEIVSPSLEGVLSDDELIYEGVRRPAEVLRVLDGPSTKGARNVRRTTDPHDRKILEEYFHDLYSVFIKRLSSFVVMSESAVAESVRLQAMLQELVKIKGLLSKK